MLWDWFLWILSKETEKENENKQEFNKVLNELKNHHPLKKSIIITNKKKRKKNKN